MMGEVIDFKVLKPVNPPTSTESPPPLCYQALAEDSHGWYGIGADHSGPVPKVPFWPFELLDE